MKRLFLLLLLSGMLFGQTWIEFPESSLGFSESFSINTRNFHFKGKIYRNACDSGFNDRLSEADTAVQRKWLPNCQVGSAGMYGDVENSSTSHDASLIRDEDSVYVFSFANSKVKMHRNRGNGWEYVYDYNYTSEFQAYYGVCRNSLKEGSNIITFTTSRNIGYPLKQRKAYKTTFNVETQTQTHETVWLSNINSEADLLELPIPRSFFKINEEYYILTHQRLSGYPVRLLKKGTNWQTYDTIVVFDSLSKILDCKVVDNKAFFIVDGSGDRSEAGLYQFDGSVLERIFNWDNNYYVIGFYVQPGELLVSVSDALINGVNKLYQRSFGKWNKTVFNLPYASNNIIREGNRIWIWRTYDIYNFLPYDSSAKFYYTDNIPVLPDTRFLTLKRRK